MPGFGFLAPENAGPKLKLRISSFSCVCNNQKQPGPNTTFSHLLAYHFHQAMAESDSNKPVKPSLTPILRVTSASKAAEWYAKLGFKHDWEHRFSPDFPAFVSVSNGDMRIFLSEHTGDANPGGLIFLTVPNVDEFVKDVVGQAPNADVEVEDSEGIGMRDVELLDLDGNRVRVGTPLWVLKK